MRCNWLQLEDMRKNEDPRLSFSTPEFKEAQRIFTDNFKVPPLPIRISAPVLRDTCPVLSPTCIRSIARNTDAEDVSLWLSLLPGKLSAL